MKFKTRNLVRDSAIVGLGFAAMLVVFGQSNEAEAAACVKINVPASDGGTTPLMMLVPDASVATYAAKGFVEEACPAGETFTSQRIEAACQKFENYPSEARTAIHQTYGVTTAEICEQGREAVAGG